MVIRDNSLSYGGIDHHRDGVEFFMRKRKVICIPSLEVPFIYIENECNETGSTELAGCFPGEVYSSNSCNGFDGSNNILPPNLHYQDLIACPFFVRARSFC